MKKILAILLLGLGLSGCAGMELTSVSVGVGHAHSHYYPRYYYSPPYPAYRQRVIIRERVIVKQPHRHTQYCDHNRNDRRRDRRHRN